MPNEMPLERLQFLRAAMESAAAISRSRSLFELNERNALQALGEILPFAKMELERLAKGTTNLMDTNDYTAVPKSEKVQAAEDAARIAQLQRDVDYWRGHAETAEAVAASQAEMRYNEGDEAGQKDEQERGAS